MECYSFISLLHNAYYAKKMSAYRVYRRQASGMKCRICMWRTSCLRWSHCRRATSRSALSAFVEGVGWGVGGQRRILHWTIFISMSELQCLCTYVTVCVCFGLPAVKDSVSGKFCFPSHISHLTGKVGPSSLLLPWVGWGGGGGGCLERESYLLLAWLDRGLGYV